MQASCHSAPHLAPALLITSPHPVSVGQEPLLLVASWSLQQPPGTERKFLLGYHVHSTEGWDGGTSNYHQFPWQPRSNLLTESADPVHLQFSPPMTPFPGSEPSPEASPPCSPPLQALQEPEQEAFLQFHSWGSRTGTCPVPASESAAKPAPPAAPCCRAVLLTHSLAWGSGEPLPGPAPLQALLVGAGVALT